MDRAKLEQTDLPRIDSKIGCGGESQDSDANYLVDPVVLLAASLES